VREDTLDKLLDLLGPDKQSAALEYRKLHQRLSRFFEWNNVEDPEALADEAIDRLGKRVLEKDVGEKVRNLSAFALGVARLLLLEEARRQQQKTDAVRNWEAHTPDTPHEDTAMDEALQHCLAKLQADRRKLVEQYYTFNSGEKIKLHQRLAHELGITPNALRNRALRARQDLEDCMRKFLKDNSE
jgi:DNA-directed RNA polymerase specialized sigma24 family protein